MSYFLYNLVNMDNNIKEQNKKHILHKICVINNEIKTIKCEINEIKILMDEIKKLNMSYIEGLKKNEDKKKGWFY